MKILFISGSMRGGGAERVISLLSNEFIKLNYDVSIMVVSGESVYKLNENIKYIKIYKNNEINSNILNRIGRRINFYPRLIKKIYREKADIVITVHGGFNGKIILISKLLGLSVIASEHTNHTVGKYNLFRLIEKRFIYKFADALTVLTKFDYIYYKKFIKHVHIVPNPVTFIPTKTIKDKKNVILAVGRLNSWYSKGFDNLIYIFSEISKKHPDWKLRIAGEGIEGKEYLMKIALQLNILDKIEFIGFQKQIQKIMEDSSIFILTSRFEGFPMVLIEAMSQGCACISFDCPAGPGEIISNNINGILVENQNNDKMISNLEKLIIDSELRKKLSNNALKRSKDFSMQNITKMWLDLFYNIKHRNRL